MEIDREDIIAKIRTAIDDIVPTAADSFTDDTDAELWQATWHAVQALLMELPLDMLLPASMLPLNPTNPTPPNDPTPPYQITNADGSGSIVLSDDFLRFVSLQLSTWLRPVTELMEPGSNEALSQTSKWGRGTPEKPRAMLDYGTDGSLILRYWTAGKSNGAYVHTVSILNYIPKAQLNNGEEAPFSSETSEEQTSSETSEETTETITCALKDIAQPLVINHAAAIFFEGKKEPEIAEKFRNM